MNILNPLYTPAHITFKEANNNFQAHESWDFSLATYYCATQKFRSLLGTLQNSQPSPFAYTTSKNYGWRCNYFLIPKRIVLQEEETSSPLYSADYFILAEGYQTPNKMKYAKDPIKLYQLEEFAESYLTSSRVYKLPLNEKQILLNQLLLDFASIVKEAHS